MWTCRAGEDLVSAVNWCEEQGLIFDCINDNLPEIIDKFGNNSRKIFCDYYIDDRAINMNVLNLLNYLGGFRNEKRTI